MQYYGILLLNPFCTLSQQFSFAYYRTFFHSLSFIAEKDYQNDSFAFYSFENFYLPYFARSYHFIVKSLQFFFAYILSYFLPFFTINHRKEKMHEEFSELEFAFRIPTAKTWKIRVRFIPLFLSLRKKASNNKLSRIREPAAIPPSHRRCVVSFRLKCELGSTCKLRLESELETSLDTLWKRSSPPVSSSALRYGKGRAILDINSPPTVRNVGYHNASSASFRHFREWRNVSLSPLPLLLSKIYIYIWKYKGWNIKA